MNIGACWKNGLNNIRAVLKNSGIFTPKELDRNKILSEERRLDVFCPYLKTIGVLNGTNTLIDLSNAMYDAVDALGSDTNHSRDRTRPTVSKRPKNGRNKNGGNKLD